MHLAHHVVALGTLSLLVLAPPPPGWASSHEEEKPGAGAASSAPSDEELAKKTQNPVSDLISLPFQNNINFQVGPGDRVQNVLNIQPVWPFKLTDHWNLITRTILPVISQPPLSPGDDRTNGLGDTTLTGFLSPREPGGLIWGAGPIFLIPTSTSDDLGEGEFGLGPSLLFLGMPGNWVVGSLFSNVWSVTGGKDVNLFTWQVIANYNFAKGWYLASTPIITSNWKNEKGDRWTVPLGGGVGKIFRVGPMPMNAQLQAFYNVVNPDFGPDWSMRIQVQLLFPK